jgi:hypothetical protein
MRWRAMGNLIVNETDISIHGRGSYRDAIKYDDGDGGFLDISALKLFIEVDGVSIRLPLTPDAEDPTTQWVVLDRIHIEKLTKSPQRYAIVDETDMEDDLPFVLVEGTIKYHGYRGLPDTVTE